MGGVVAGLGLVAVSQLAGPEAQNTAEAPPGSPQPQAAPPAAATSDTAPPAPLTPVPDTPAAPPPALTDAALPEPAAVPPLVQSDAPMAAQTPVTDPSPAAPASESAAPSAPRAAPPALVGLEGDSAATAAAAPAEPPAQPATTAPQGSTRAPAVPAPPLRDLAGGTPAPDARLPAAPPAPGGDAPPTATLDEALLQPLPVTPPSDGSASLPPTPPLDGPADDVITGRLPRIGDPAPPRQDAPSDAAADLALSQELPPRERYARDFAGAAGKPMFAIMLADTGAVGVDRAELAALSLPLSIVIDPLSEGAAARAALWRAGGQEVVMAASGIPAGAKASDLEQSFQALAQALPEAVAVIDATGSSFQDNRPLSTMVVPILAAQGRGLVTFDRGLNAADQVARREGLAATRIFRRLDAEDEDTPLIRRYLDRAAFKAAQDGRVAVYGTLRPETVTAILEWAVEGRSATVTLAPISALMTQEGG